MVVARHLMILGRLQGVFYRNWAKQTATGLGLAGWVRNRLDGSVEAVIEGANEAVERFTALAAEGPPAPQVSRVEAADMPVEGLKSFEKKPTC